MDIKMPMFIAILFAFLAVFMPVQALASGCGVDVYSLDVQDGKIIGYVRNTGDTIDLIDYTIYVNGDEVRTGSFELDAYTARRIEHSYSFGHGEYEIEMEAESDCGDSDSRSVTYNVLESYMCSNPSGFEGQERCDYIDRRYLECEDGEWETVDIDDDDDYYGEYCYNCNACGDNVCNCGETADTCRQDCGMTCNPMYLDTYRCNGVIRQRLHLDYDCNYEWFNWERCQDDCFDGYCTGYYPGGGGGTSGGYECGVSITGFDYIDHVSEGSPAWVKVTAENTGDRSETITVRLYIDGSQWSSGTLNLYEGEDGTKTFNFYLDAGKHTIKAEAKAGCGSSDSKQASMDAQASGTFPQACNYNGVCEYGESYGTCPHDCPAPQQAASYTTGADVHPDTLDIERYGTGIVSIDITSSRKQTFTLAVSGIPEDWVSYPGSLEMDAGNRRVYLYITPKDTGTYSLSLSVRAEAESKEFVESVGFYVSVPDAGNSGLAGLVSGASANMAAIVVSVIVVAAIVVYIGFRKLKADDGLDDIRAKYL
jgi:hypothetical protein